MESLALTEQAVLPERWGRGEGEALRGEVWTLQEGRGGGEEGRGIPVKRDLTRSQNNWVLKLQKGTGCRRSACTTGMGGMMACTTDMGTFSQGARLLPYCNAPPSPPHMPPHPPSLPPSLTP